MPKGKSAEAPNCSRYSPDLSLRITAPAPDLALLSQGGPQSFFVG